MTSKTPAAVNATLIQRIDYKTETRSITVPLKRQQNTHRISTLLPQSLRHVTQMRYGTPHTVLERLVSLATTHYNAAPLRGDPF
jgi:hypothetical protein